MQKISVICLLLFIYFPLFSSTYYFQEIIGNEKKVYSVIEIIDSNQNRLLIQTNDRESFYVYCTADYKTVRFEYFNSNENRSITSDINKNNLYLHINRNGIKEEKYLKLTDAHGTNP